MKVGGVDGCVFSGVWWFVVCGICWIWGLGFQFLVVILLAAIRRQIIPVRLDESRALISHASASLSDREIIFL